MSAALVALPAALHAHEAATKSGGGAGSLVVLAVVAGAFVLLVLRGRRARATQARQQSDSLVIGATVQTRAGLIATLVEKDQDEVVLEIAPGVRARFVPQAIARVVPDPVRHADDPDDTGTDPLAD